jgi:hypothetical protein
MMIDKICAPAAMAAHVAAPLVTHTMKVVHRVSRLVQRHSYIIHRPMVKHAVGWGAASVCGAAGAPFLVAGPVPVPTPLLVPIHTLVVPEPSSILIFLVAIAALALLRVTRQSA